MTNIAWTAGTRMVMLDAHGLLQVCTIKVGGNDQFSGKFDT